MRLTHKELWVFAIITLVQSACFVKLFDNAIWALVLSSAGSVCLFTFKYLLQAAIAMRRTRQRQRMSASQNTLVFERIVNGKSKRSISQTSLYSTVSSYENERFVNGRSNRSMVKQYSQVSLCSTTSRMSLSFQDDVIFTEKSPQASLTKQNSQTSLSSRLSYEDERILKLRPNNELGAQGLLHTKKKRHDKMVESSFTVDASPHDTDSSNYVQTSHTTTLDDVAEETKEKDEIENYFSGSASNVEELEKMIASGLGGSNGEEPNDNNEGFVTPPLVPEEEIVIQESSVSPSATDVGDQEEENIATSETKEEKEPTGESENDNNNVERQVGESENDNSKVERKVDDSKNENNIVVREVEEIENDNKVARQVSFKSTSSETRSEGKAYYDIHRASEVSLSLLDTTVFDWDEEDKEEKKASTSSMDSGISECDKVVNRSKSVGSKAQLPKLQFEKIIKEEKKKKNTKGNAEESKMEKLLLKEQKTLDHERRRGSGSREKIQKVFSSSKSSLKARSSSLASFFKKEKDPAKQEGKKKESKKKSRGGSGELETYVEESINLMATAHDLLGITMETTTSDDVDKKEYLQGAYYTYKMFTAS